MMPRVSILIPAYMAAAFIDRTMLFARGQTLRDVAIIVSIDACDDDTWQIVDRHAREDDRVVVHAHRKRLGWVGNVNFLLDQVRTPHAFLYFHDDILLPHYAERLHAALEGAPEAVSVHCDMGHFGGDDRLSTGRSYGGSAAERLLAFLASPERGSPLRSMVRAEALRGVRMVEGDNNGLWANELFLMKLLAAGPAIHLPQTLYLRWDKRKGGLTDGWLGIPAEQLLLGFRDNLNRTIDVALATARDETEKRTLLMACFGQELGKIIQLEESTGRTLFSAPEDLHPALVGLERPSEGFDRYGDELAGWLEMRRAWIDADRATRKGAP